MAFVTKRLATVMPAKLAFGAPNAKMNVLQPVRPRDVQALELVMIALRGIGILIVSTNAQRLAQANFAIRAMELAQVAKMVAGAANAKLNAPQLARHVIAHKTQERVLGAHPATSAPSASLTVLPIVPPAPV